MRIKNMITLSVDGNISSGKSTLVSKLVELLPKNGLFSTRVQDGAISKPVEIRPHVEVIPEPLDKWCNVKGHNLLEMFYKNPQKLNFLFENYVQLTRLTDIVKSNAAAATDLPSEDKPMVSNIHFRIMERSLQNNRHCFMELARRNGTLHPAEFSVLAEWHKWMEEHTECNLDVIIYLQTDPTIAYERMKTRAREAEDLCSMEYLTDLHGAYEDWLIRKFPKQTAIIVLDANQSKEKIISECILKLAQYVHSLKNKQ